MNTQEIFDKVATHLLTQNKKSLLHPDSKDEFSSRMCAYRNPQGLKCAIGALIPDSLYDPAFEEMGSITTLPRGLFPKIGINYVEHHFFLLELQVIHDRYPVYEWKGKLRVLAKKYELSDAVLDKVHVHELSELSTTLPPNCQ